MPFAEKIPSWRQIKLERFGKRFLGKTIFKISKGEIPEEQIPEREISEGKIPKGEISEGEIPDGELPEGDISGGQILEGGISEGKMPAVVTQKRKVDYILKVLLRWRCLWYCSICLKLGWKDLNICL
mgnify:CR=1 FL=1